MLLGTQRVSASITRTYSSGFDWFFRVSKPFPVTPLFPARVFSDWDEAGMAPLALVYWQKTLPFTKDPEDGVCSWLKAAYTAS